MRIFVVRHGESENNQKALWTGWADVSITDKGREDAQKVGEFLKNISFDKVYVSDLKRAIETLESAIPGYEYETSPLLREINVGTLANQPLSILTDSQKETIALDGYSEFNGETREEFKGRIIEFMKKIETSGEENIAVFTHAGWMRSIFDIVTQASSRIKNVCCNNCALGIFEYTGERWRVHSWINLL